MNSTFRSGMISGFVVGAALTAFGFLIARRVPEVPRPVGVRRMDKPVDDPAAREVFDELVRMKARVAELEKEAAAKAKAEEPKPAATPEKPAADLKALFATLSDSGLAAFRSPKFAEALDAVKAQGKPAIDFLAAILKT